MRYVAKLMMKLDQLYDTMLFYDNLLIKYLGELNFQ